MKLVIGIVGPPLAGKETIADKLDELFKRDGLTVSRHRFSDILRETLTLWGIPLGRTNEQLLPRIMNAPEGFGPGTLSRAVKNRLMKDATDVGILDGARWLPDEVMLRELPKEGIASLIIYVTASPERRYARLKARNRSGEATQTWEDFKKHEVALTEIDIPAIGSRADVTIANDTDDVQQLLQAVEAAYRTNIRPRLN